MTRTLHIASGISVLFTTFVFGHIVYLYVKWNSFG
jgi:hypothetical protein